MTDRPSFLRERGSILLGMATTANIRLNQGETFRWPFLLKIPGATSGALEPMPLTGCTGRMQVREKYGAPVLLDLSSENRGVVVSEDEEGRIDVVMTAEQTDTLGATANPLKPRLAAVYDLELTYPSGDVRRVIQGAITISPNITREVPDA